MSSFYRPGEDVLHRELAHADRDQDDLERRTGLLEWEDTQTPVVPCAFASPILDDFNRADEIPANPAVWEPRAYEGELRRLKIANNRIANHLSGGWFSSGAYLPAGTFADCEAFCTVEDSNWWLGIMARIQPGSDTDLRVAGYTFAVHPSGSTVLQRENASGGATVIANSPSLSPPIAVGDKIGICCVGTSLKGWIRRAGGAWTMHVQGTDSTYSSGHLGLFHGSDSSADDFGGGGT